MVASHLRTTNVEWTSSAGRCGVLSALRSSIASALASVAAERGTEPTTTSKRSATFSKLRAEACACCGSSPPILTAATFKTLIRWRACNALLCADGDWRQPGRERKRQKKEKPCDQGQHLEGVTEGEKRSTNVVDAIIECDAVWSRSKLAMLVSFKQV
jgi:hypothetical protein